MDIVVEYYFYFYSYSYKQTKYIFQFQGSEHGLNANQNMICKSKHYVHKNPLSHRQG